MNPMNTPETDETMLRHLFDETAEEASSARLARLERAAAMTPKESRRTRLWWMPGLAAAAAGALLWAGVAPGERDAPEAPVARIVLPSVAQPSAAPAMPRALPSAADPTASSAELEDADMMFAVADVWRDDDEVDALLAATPEDEGDVRAWLAAATEELSDDSF